MEDGHVETLVHGLNSTLIMVLPEEPALVKTVLALAKNELLLLLLLSPLLTEAEPALAKNELLLSEGVPVSQATVW